MSPWLSDALLRSQSDERLVALAREGRERAFTLLVERHRRTLLVLARREVGEGRAEDAVQQGLLQAWSALARGARVEHPRAWLHQIVRHAAWKGVAGAGADAEPLDPEWAGGRTADAEVEGRLDLDALLVGMAALPERQRAAIVQTEWEGRSREEIAGSLGLSEGAVRQLVYRARSSLRTAVAVLTPTPLAAWAARSIGNDGMVARLGDALAPAAGTGALVKISTVVIASGAVATGLAEVGNHQVERPAPRAKVVTTTPRAGADGPASRSSLVPGRPATARGRTRSRAVRSARGGGSAWTSAAGRGQLTVSRGASSGRTDPGRRGDDAAAGSGASGPGRDGSGTSRDGHSADGRDGGGHDGSGGGPRPDGGDHSGSGSSGPGPAPSELDSRGGEGGPGPSGGSGGGGGGGDERSGSSGSGSGSSGSGEGASY